ncbi:MAG: hypothetical protein AAF219_04920 [Myxococcota bacterium]
MTTVKAQTTHGMRGCRALLALAWVATACASEAGGADEEEAGVEQFSINVEADRSRILAEEESLQKQQATVESEREQLERARGEIGERLARLSKNDRKQREALEAEQRNLTKQETELRTRLGKFEKDRSKLEREKTQLLERVNRMQDMATSSARLDERERSLTRLQSQLKSRADELEKIATGLKREREQQNKQMAAMIERVEALAEALEGNLDKAGGSRTVYVQKSSGGSKATAASVRDLERKARRKMQSRGILSADLSPTARQHERNAKSASKAKDFEQAADHYNQLFAAIERTKVNAEFVEAKMRRINSEIGKRKAPAKVSGLLNDVSASFTDGRYDRANRKINEIYALIRGG